MLNFVHPEVMIFAKVTGHLISQLKQADISPLFNYKGKDIEVIFFIEDFSCLNDGPDLIEFEFELIRRVGAYGFFSMLFNKMIDILFKVR